MHKIFSLCLLMFIFSFPNFALHANSYSFNHESPMLLDETDSYIQALASLAFHTCEWEKQLNAEDQEAIFFSQEEVARLWDIIARYLEYSPATFMQMQQKNQFSKAYQRYYHAKELWTEGEAQKAHQVLKGCSRLLLALWEKSLETENPPEEYFQELDVFLRAKRNNNLEDNPYIPHAAKKKMRPFLISHHHPMKAVLDSLFLNKRVTLNHQTFQEAGFSIIAARPRSHILVAKHPLFSGYLLKAYLDSELRKKRRKESWQWIVMRCEGAEKVRQVIQKYRLKHFVVADKWIYPLPAEPSPPRSTKYTRHLAVLLVTDMDLAPDTLNYQAWRSVITKEHLDELYLIISRAKGSSYRPDNISYTNRNQFAFIDTEYPLYAPDFKNIREFLSSDMQRYWDHLVKRGGH